MWRDRASALLAVDLCSIGSRLESVVIRAAEVVTALGADQLAAMSLEPMPACGTNLAVMVDRTVAGRSIWRRGLGKLRGKFRIEGCGKLRQHG